MKHERRFLIGALVMVALAAALALIAPGAQGALAQTTVIYVDVDAQGANNGSSWHNAYTDLQDAMDVAASGDQIWVAAGTYKPSHRFIQDDPRSAAFQMANGVAIYGGFEPDWGIIRFGDRDWDLFDAILSGNIGAEDLSDDNSYHVFYHPAGTDLDGTAILDGFTITGGYADDWGGDPAQVRGAGMYNWHSSPSLANCTFLGNLAAHSGGAMFNLNDSSPTLSNCVFRENEAWQLGGAMYNGDASSPVLSDANFRMNRAEGGGGMYNTGDSSPVLGGNCFFTSNAADYGAGMFNRFGASPHLDGCVFSANLAAYAGGGMHNDEASPTLNDCEFRFNGAEWGGGVHNYNGSSPVLTNCIFRNNRADYGGAMSNDSLASPTVTNCTFSSNIVYAVGGIYNTNESSPTLTNCILWGNGEVEIYNQGSIATITYSDIQGGYLGTGNINVDPLFVDPSLGDLHLQSGSPCIDAGYNYAPSLPTYDFEGDFRRLDGNGDGWAVVDMGVDEYASQQPAPQPVPIIITPDLPSDVIKLSSPRPVAVAILTSKELHVEEVAADTVMFAGAPHAGFEYKDVDGDGATDLLLYFYPEEMDELTPDSNEATLIGETVEGGLIEGTAKVKVRE